MSAFIQSGRRLLRGNEHQVESKGAEGGSRGKRKWEGRADRAAESIISRMEWRDSGPVKDQENLC